MSEHFHVSRKYAFFNIIYCMAELKNVKKFKLHPLNNHNTIIDK